VVHGSRLARSRPGVQLAVCLTAMLLNGVVRSEEQAPSVMPSDRLETGLVVIGHLALTADGKLLAVAGKSDYGSSGVIQLWDLAQGKKLHEEEAAPNLVAISPDGRRVVYQGRNGGLRWLDAARESKKHERLDFDRLIDVCFLRDGSIVIAGFNTTGSALTEPAEEKTEQDGEQDKGSAPKADETQLVGTNGEEIVGWDLVADQPRFVHGAGSLPIRALDVFPDGSRVAIGTSEGGLCVWDVRTGQCTVKLAEKADYDVAGVSVSPDGKYVAAKLYATEVDVWDVASGEKVTTLSGSGNLCPDVALLADGATVAAASSHARGVNASLWDAASGREVAVLRQAPLGEPGSHRLGRLAVSADGRRLAASVAEGTVVLWDIASYVGEPVPIPPPPQVRLKPEVSGAPAAGSNEEPKNEVGPSAASSASKPRTWTSADGRFTVKAKFQQRTGNLVYLVRQNGQTLQIRFDQLSEVDRRFVRDATAE